MMEIPEVSSADAAFGSIKHLPKTIPEEFHDRYDNVYCKAISHWFFHGAERAENGMIINGVRFTAKPDVDHMKAIRAIKAVLCSWEPKHEHKIAGCAYMLSEWFQLEIKDGGRNAEVTSTVTRPRGNSTEKQRGR